MTFAENLFDVLFWAVIILSPIVLLGSMWRVYKWAVKRRQRKAMEVVLDHLELEQPYRQSTWDDLRRKYNVDKN